MQPRAVRIPLYEATVSFDQHPASLVNISRTGALLRVHSPAEAGHEAPLVISHNHTMIQIDVRVVRTCLAPVPGRIDEGTWYAGVKFVAPPPLEIAQLLRRIISTT